MERDLGSPPADADEWSNEQWIEWLTATDADLAPADQPTPATRLGRATRSAGGQLLGGAMTGLAQALYGPRSEKPAIVVEAGEPHDDQPIELHLDEDHPEKSYVVLRPDPDAAV